MRVTVSFLTLVKSAKETLKLINATDADYLHIDLMDGKFVEPKVQQVSELKSLLPIVEKPLDVHIMGVNPTKYLPFFASFNSVYFVFHLEAVKDVSSTIEEIKMTGLKPGIALKKDTDIEDVKPYLKDIDQILLMSCVAGYGGTNLWEEEEFVSSMTKKISDLKAYREENNLNYIISIDGGINNETVVICKEAGIDMVIGGSYVTKGDDYQERINNLRI